MHTIGYIGTTTQVLPISYYNICSYYTSKGFNRKTVS